MESIRTTAAPAPVQGAPYSQAIDAGALVFVSGQVPLDASGALVGPAIGDQTRQCLDNVAAILAEAGLCLADVAKTTVYMTDLDEFSGMNTAYAAAFAAHAPARATVGVAALPAGARVEIEAIAVRRTTAG